jgi:hypothetical protein
MNKTSRIIIALVILVAAGAVGWYLIGSGSGAASGKTVALVNGTAITQAELASIERQFAVQQGLSATSTPLDQFQSAALNTLIGTTLLKQEAAAAGITASSTEVEAQLTQAKARFSTTQAYQQALADQGLTEDTLRAQIADNLVIDAYLQQKLNLAEATATEAEIKQVYDSQTKGATNVPPLSQVHDQIAQYITQQEQQQMVSQYVSQLRSSADVQILIATSTPAAAAAAAAAPSAGTTTPGA